MRKLYETISFVTHVLLFQEDCKTGVIFSHILAKFFPVVFSAIS